MEFDETMNVGVGQSVIKRKTRRSPLQQTSKNTDMKASMAAFPSDECISTEGRDKVDCMDNLFNIDNFNSEEEDDLANLIKHNKFPADMVTAHIRAVIEHLQLEVNLDINNVTLQLEDTKILQDQLGWKEKMLDEELKVIKNDTEQYEWYLSDQHYYDFKNDTWDSLMNLGRDELQNRQIKLQKMKSDLKNQNQILLHRMRICNFLLWTLNNEVTKRQQRQHMVSLCSHKEVNLSHIIRGEVEQLQNLKSLFDMTLRQGMSSVGPVVKSQSSILTKQKLGCTFDFLLHHRVNKGGSVNEYNAVVNIFKRNIPVFEYVVNSSKTNRLLENVLKKQMSRLKWENKFYLDKISANSDSQGVNEELSYSFSFNKLNTENSCQSLQDVSNSSVPSQNRVHITSTSCLSHEQNVQTYSELNQRKPEELNNAHTEFRNDSCKRQENERYLIPNSQQNDLKMTNSTEIEEYRKQAENKCKKSEMITQLNLEQDSGVEEKQKHRKESNKPKTISCTNVKKLKQNKKHSNIYGLRSESETENSLKLELHSDSEIEVIGHDVAKPALKSDVEKRTQKNNKHQDGSISHHVNKNSVQKNKKEVTRLLERSESVKSSYKNKTELIKKLFVRMESLEKLMQETNLELSNIKEGTMAFQRSMEEFKCFLTRNKDCECGSGTETKGEEEKRSELLKSLKIMHIFLKRSDKYKNLIEERELLFSDFGNCLPTDEIELFVLRAARDIQELSLTELKQMETKDLKLKDISKILTSVQDLMQCEEDGYCPAVETPVYTDSEGSPTT